MRKQPIITHKKLLEILDYNPFTGIFIWKINTKGNKGIGSIAGCRTKKGYEKISIFYRDYRSYRLAWFHYYGYMPENDIDHRDRIKHHNWILNLRQATQSCNMRNTGNHITNTSGVKGVYWSNNKEKWVSFIQVNKKPKEIGAYKEFNEAVCARLVWEQCLNWSGCDSNSPAYQYVKENIQ